MALFISYSSQDKGAIEPLRNALRRAHQQVWMDEELGGGEAWWRTILEQIRNCEVFIVALSDNQLASKPCQAELRYARALQRPILPVQIGPVTNVRLNPLAETQMIDFRNPTADAGIQLMGALQAQQAQLKPLPAELPEEPPVPFAYLMRLAHNIAEPQLSARQQSDLVSDLKHGLDEDGDDPAARQDIRQLLCMLRDRNDVAWRVRTDIESLLAAIDAQPSTGQRGQDFGSPSSRLSPPPSGQPWPNSGPIPQPFPSANTSTYQPPPGTGPQPVMGPPPVGPYAGPYSDGGGRKGRGSGLKWLIGAGVGAAVVAIVVVAAINFWPHPSPAPAPLVAPERLESVLLTAAQVNTVMGASTMQGGKLGQAPANASAQLSIPACNGALYPGESPAYNGSGYTKLNYLVVAEPGDHNDHFVDQDVATFPSADAANAFVKKSADQWRSCAGQVVTGSYDNGNTFRWTFGNVVGDAPRITQLDTQEDGNGWACQRVLSAVSNVVIDVRACGYAITDQASRIADEIAANASK
ncbi:MAG: sensor domain-containing protein [Mycobacterium sp.]|nr:sensor domain-containing protein [Mycobacterium sp.]MBV9723066.1 sensor domain-containing protein [Mycobacterium sp.]